MIKQCKWMLALLIGLSSIACAGSLLTTAVIQSNSEQIFTAEGVVEAVKGSMIAPQVSGSITVLSVKAGDRVKAGQLLARIDTRMATQQAMTNQAQVAAAQAQLSAARSEYERKRRLYENNISAKPPWSVRSQITKRLKLRLKRSLRKQEWLVCKLDYTPLMHLTQGW